MKKLLIVAVALFLFSFQSQKTEKTLTVKLTFQQWQTVLTIMDRSEAPHTTVMEVQGWLVKQLNDTTFQKTTQSKK